MLYTLVGVKCVSTDSAPPATSYTNPESPRLINANFLAGLNTLDFTVRNDDDVGPMAFRAEFTSDTAALQDGQVPEPATLALLGAALGGFGLSRRRKAREPA